MSRIRIAVDGPVASGKSTVAREVAHSLGYLYLDTGAMYRAVTLKAIETGVSFDDASALAQLVSSTSLVIDYAPDTPTGYRVIMDGREVTALLITSAVAAGVSPVSSHSPVRKLLVKAQREIAAPGGVVLAGRDIGTVVLPDAEVKIFLTASVEERARRRYQEMVEKGIPTTLEAVIDNVRTRDRIDSTRQDSPLLEALGAIVIDASSLTVEQVVGQVLEAAAAKGATLVEPAAGGVTG